MQDYIDKAFGIKSAVGIRNHIKSHFWGKGISLEIDCVKVANGVKCFWVAQGRLCSHVINGSVIYVITTKELEGATKIIEESLDKEKGEE